MTSYRSHTCGELSLQEKGKTITLSGWVDSQRDHGGLIFIDLRDRYGTTQIVFNPETCPEAHALAQEFRNEFVIKIQGEVSMRPDSMVNKKMATGEIEILVESAQILSSSDTIPFQIQDQVDTSEVTRLKHRYLDLRRAPMQRNLKIRHTLNHTIRNFLESQNFLEIETPYLTKSTPEGARDYVVPSRVHKGKFFALPQSPQLFKQILMIAGMDRYYQIVRCFRDEDLRADRQPEFTQLDMELSFTDQAQIQSIMENLMKTIMKKVLNVDIKLPFPKMTYAEAMAEYASDKPDMRYPIPMVELSEVLAKTEFKVFQNILSSRGEIRGIRIPGGDRLSRSQIDVLTKNVQNFGAKGLVWIRKKDTGLSSSIEKFLSPDELQGIAASLRLDEGDVGLVVADQASTARAALEGIKKQALEKADFAPSTDWAFLWVEDFPLFEYTDEGHLTSIHHPFTQPHPDDKEKVLNKTDLGNVRSNAYDLVLNGFEIGGGSIRIHESDLQEAIFQALGMDKEEAQEKFGFFLKALSYGTPPHGGIALGLDRIAMLLAKGENLRDVIAFPKTQNASDLMVEAPGTVDLEQLLELGLSLLKVKDD